MTLSLKQTNSLNKRCLVVPLPDKGCTLPRRGLRLDPSPAQVCENHFCEAQAVPGCPRAVSELSQAVPGCPWAVSELSQAVPELCQGCTRLSQSCPRLSLGCSRAVPGCPTDRGTSPPSSWGRTPCRVPPFPFIQQQPGRAGTGAPVLQVCQQS